MESYIIAIMVVKTVQINYWGGGGGGAVDACPLLSISL